MKNGLSPLTKEDEKSIEQFNELTKDLDIQLCETDALGISRNWFNDVLNKDRLKTLISIIIDDIRLNQSKVRVFFKGKPTNIVKDAYLKVNEFKVKWEYNRIFISVSLDSKLTDYEFIDNAFTYFFIVNDKIGTFTRFDDKNTPTNFIDLLNEFKVAYEITSNLIKIPDSNLILNGISQADLAKSNLLEKYLGKSEEEDKPKSLHSLLKSIK